MKNRLLSLVAAVLTAGVCCADGVPLKISVFAGLIDRVAHEQKVSCEEAANLLKKAGVHRQIAVLRYWLNRPRALWNLNRRLA